MRERSDGSGAGKPSGTVRDHMGKAYPSVTAMCQAWDVSLSTYYARIGRGASKREALEQGRGAAQVTDHLGNTYPSVNAMCEHWGVKRATYDTRIRNGWTVEQALTTDKGGSRVCTDHLGNQFPTKKAMCEHWGISYSNYIQRHYAGWSLDDILTTPVDTELSRASAAPGGQSVGQTAGQPGAQDGLLAQQQAGQQGRPRALRMSVVPDCETATVADLKAAWRATREQLGITRRMVCHALGVSYEAVKYWENPRKPNVPFKEAFDFLQECWGEQMDYLDYALEAIGEIDESSDPVVLGIWLSEDDYRAHADVSGRWEEHGWTVVNANQRALAHLIEDRGGEVVWRSFV